MRRSLSGALTRTTNSGDATSRTTPQILADWPPGVAAIEYFLGAESAWLFSVDTSGKVHAWNLLVDGRKSRDLVADVRRFLDGVAQSKQQMYEGLSRHRGYNHSWQDKLYALRWTLIPGDLLEQLKKADTVVVVPHHILHYFPFAALVTRRDARLRVAPLEMIHPTFLIDESFDLLYTPSLGVWDLLRSRPDDKLERVAAVGIANAPGQQPLQGVEADMRNLKEAFRERVDTMLVESDATESRVRQLLAQPGMVLFAMHGRNQAARPLDSFLACHKDDDHDGRLTTRELLTADIRPALVLIGACDSGLGERSPPPGDDLLSAQRAFLQSGARTVVSALWDVDDGAGPELMKELFIHLARGDSAARALARSQRELLKNGRGADDDPWVHPYFWAAYTAAGDDRTRFAQLTDRN